MSNYKCHLILAILLALVGCKPSNFAFKESTQLNKSLFLNIPAIAGDTTLTLDSVTVYKARLEEQLVDKNDIPEYKLVNDKSRKSGAVPFEIDGNYNHLFLFILHTKPDKKLCVFLSTGFNVDTVCTGLGPVYQGNIRQGRIYFFRTLKIRQEGANYRFSLAAKETGLIFYFDESDRRKDPQVIRINEIIRNKPNTISGTKPLIYNVSKIFNDQDALVFSYETTYY